MNHQSSNVYQAILFEESAQFLRGGVSEKVINGPYK